MNSEGLCAPRDQPEKERETDRQKERCGTRALMEQRCFNQHGVGIYTVLQGKIKIKIPDLQNIGDPYYRERVVNNRFYRMVPRRKRVLITV